MADASAIYREFEEKPGSQWIAGEYALRGLIRRVKERQPRRVLEIGPGLGTTTRALIAALDEAGGEYRLAGIEEVRYCLEHLPANLGPDIAKTTVVQRYGQIPEGFEPWDFVLVDGGWVTDFDYPDAPTVTQELIEAENRLYVSALAPRAVLFVENGRPHQRAIFERELASQGRSYSYAHYRPLSGRKGYHLFQLDPTAAERVTIGARQVVDQNWSGRGLGRTSTRFGRRVRRRLRR